jgi:hypothetical protein
LIQNTVAVATNNDRGMRAYRAQGREGVMMVHGLLARAAATVVTGAVGVAAYDALRKTLAKAPLHEAAVNATAWGLRGVRKAEETAESARLKTADIVAEARGRIGDEAPPPGVAELAADHDH